MRHAIIAPSAAHIWGAPDGCTQYPMIAGSYPEAPPGAAQLEGTASHEVAASLIEDAKTQSRHTSEKDWVGTTASNGVLITSEIYQGAEVYANDVILAMQRYGVFVSGQRSTIEIEEKVTCPRIHRLSFGSPDCRLWSAAEKTLIIWDYKFGHRAIQVFENWQLINYFAGINVPPDATVIFRIVQPRAMHPKGPIREWRTNILQLQPYVNTLRENAEQALSNKAVFRSGTHCRDCPARLHCNAAIQAGMQLYEVATQLPPKDLSNAELSLQLAIVQRARQQLEYIESGLEEEVLQKIKSGHRFLHWSISRTPGKIIWSQSTEKIIEFGKLYGFNLAKPAQPITPTQAKTGGIPAEIVDSLSKRQPGTLKLQRETSQEAREVFSK